MRVHHLLLSAVTVASLTFCGCVDLGHEEVAQQEDGVLVARRNNVPAGAPMMRNISNREYRSAISDLIGERLSPELFKGWTPTTQFSGFDAVPWSNLDTKAIRDRSETLEAILDKATVSPKIMTCSVTSSDGIAYGGCAKTILEPVAMRAFSRPLKPDEKAQLAHRYDEGVNLARTLLTDPNAIFTDGVRAALGSIFLAPQFLNRAEQGPDPDYVGDRDLDAYELANRLSFMFIGSLPDDELWARAKDGSLASDPGMLMAQARRLLDVRVDTFVQTFMGQWFDFREYETATPGSIEEAMYGESWRTLADVIKEQLPAPAILKPGFTYLNAPLAAHYSLPGTFSGELQKVPTDERGGILQQGSWLTLSASPIKTSPIHRGRLVQERLLCKVIPPPGPALLEQIQAVQASIPETATVKQRLDSHRNAARVCKTCHKYMDPIGLGLEGFDPFGKTRTTYADTGYRVETDSEILGTPFATFGELNTIVANLPDYSRCAAEKVATFGLRRIVTSTEGDDTALLDYLTYPVGNSAPSLREVVLRLVQSNAFRRVHHGARS